MLDFCRVNCLSLRFADAAWPDMPLGPGVHAIGRDDAGLPALLSSLDGSVAQLTVDRRGVWMHVRVGARGLHVNGRPVRRVAMLRAGDALHVDGHELTVLGGDGETRFDDEVGPVARGVLRGIGGLHHGRCHVLDAGLEIGSGGAMQVRLDASLPAAIARLTPCAAGWSLESFDEEHVPRVNGHARGSARVHVGDQIAFGAHRFVLEAPSAGPRHAHTEDVMLEPEPHMALSNNAGAVGAMRRLPWLLLAALAMAASLALLLMYGAR